mmetsp:Transcript_22093/g.63034  ORF Transcript_22093/g.63034 Transcript_22093/m.63034 type:complete len:275 (-) Transcript_22093:175-999(-)
MASRRYASTCLFFPSTQMVAAWPDRFAASSSSSRSLETSAHTFFLMPTFRTVLVTSTGRKRAGRPTAGLAAAAAAAAHGHHCSSSICVGFLGLFLLPAAELIVLVVGLVLVAVGRVLQVEMATSPACARLVVEPRLGRIANVASVTTGPVDIPASWAGPVALLEETRRTAPVGNVLEGITSFGFVRAALVALGALGEIDVATRWFGALPVAFLHLARTLGSKSPSTSTCCTRGAGSRGNRTACVWRREGAGDSRHRDCAGDNGRDGWDEGMALG